MSIPYARDIGLTEPGYAWTADPVEMQAAGVTPYWAGRTIRRFGADPGAA
jgi:hypothetical protein